MVVFHISDAAPPILCLLVWCSTFSPALAVPTLRARSPVLHGLPVPTSARITDWKFRKGLQAETVPSSHVRRSLVPLPTTQAFLYFFEPTAGVDVTSDVFPKNICGFGQDAGDRKIIP